MESLPARSASFLDINAALRSVEVASWLSHSNESCESDLEIEEDFGDLVSDYSSAYGFPGHRRDSRMLCVGEWLQSPGRSEGEAAFKQRMMDLLDARVA